MQSGRNPAVFVRDLSGCLSRSSIAMLAERNICRFWTLLRFAWTICHHSRENRFLAASDSIFGYVLEFLPSHLLISGEFFLENAPRMFTDAFRIPSRFFCPIFDPISRFSVPDGLQCVRPKSCRISPFFEF